MNTDRLDKPPEAAATPTAVTADATATAAAAKTTTTTTAPTVIAAATISAAPDATARAQTIEMKKQIDINLVLADFGEEFATDAIQAAERLHDLLIDPVTCEARCVYLTKVRELAQHSKKYALQLEPAGPLSGVHEYVRELMWLANNELVAAIECGQASITCLVKIASRPDLLRLASRAAVDGKLAIADIVKVHQLEAWNWLRDEVVNGGLEKHLGANVVGKHVAVWKKEQPYGEIVIGDSPQAVRTAARKRWRVPNALVAETFVDAN